MCVCVCVYAAVSECVNASAAVVSEGTKKREKKKNKRQIEKGKELDCSFDCFSIRSIVSNGFVRLFFFWFSVFGFSRSKRMERTNRWPKKQKETNQAVSSFFRLFALDLFRSRFLFREMMMMMMMEKKKKMATSNRPAMAAGKRSLNFGQAKMFPFFRFIFLLYQSTKARKKKQKKGNERSQSKKNKTSSLLLLVRSSGHHASVLSTRSSVPVFHSSRFTFQRFFFFQCRFALRVLFVCFFPPVYGGVPSFVFVRLGHEAIVI